MSSALFVETNSHSIVDCRYNEIFKEIWFASAFKGATHQLEIVPNARLHYSNHLSWLDVIKKFPDPLKIKGMILTGWSRYDHMQAGIYSKFIMR